MMGIWSSTLFGSGGAIQWARWQGTLEALVVAPAPFLLVLLPMTLATSTVGLYSLGATLVFGRVFFGVPFTVDDWPAFVVAIPAAVIGLGLLGLVLATTFVLYRHANALSNMLEFPVLLVTGLLVPLSLLPGWVHPIGWVLAPTWGMRAIRWAALGGGNPWFAIGISAALGAAYVVLGHVFLGVVLRRARTDATLALA
jgi:ABC-type multidrug transport system permease subunit